MNLNVHTSNLFDHFKDEFFLLDLGKTISLPLKFEILAVFAYARDGKENGNF